MKFIIPIVDLKKFYKLCAFQNVLSKDIKLNEKTVKSYLKFRDFLFGGLVKAESYAFFIDKLRNCILLKVISKEDLSQLDNKPLNPMMIMKLFENKKHIISLSSAKNLLSLLLKVSLIDQIPIIKIITMVEENAQDKELIYNYLLRNKEFVNIKKVKKNFKDSPRAHLINDYLIELWIDDKVEIKGVDIPKEFCQDRNYKNLPPDEVNGYKSIETYRVRETGELRARITLYDNYKLYPKGD